MNPFIQVRKTTAIFLVTLVCFGLLPAAQALLPPPAPDGGYDGNNTAEGDGALFNLDVTTGFSNTALGFDALFNNTSGDVNTAIGRDALFNNTTGHDNTATGVGALSFNTTGINNTANGRDALRNNDTGNNSTAMGYFALAQQRFLPPSFIPTGNTAVGAFALTALGAGSENTAVGDRAASNGGGFDNTALGALALSTNRGGNGNTAIGRDALTNSFIGFENTAVGYRALLNTGGTLGGNNGDNNIALGASAGINLTTGDNNIDIGNVGRADESGTIRIGTAGMHNRTFIAAIFSSAVTGPHVVVNSFGRLGVAASSARLKEAIRPMDKASEAIFGLNPVTFHYKKEVDREGIPQFGLVVEEVEKVNPELIVRDREGKPYSVRYEAVNAMLLNEFLKEHRTLQELKSSAAKQEATIARQQKQIEALTAGLQKVSAQLEVRKPAPQTALNNE